MENGGLRFKSPLQNQARLPVTSKRKSIKITKHQVQSPDLPGDECVGFSRIRSYDYFIQQIDFKVLPVFFSYLNEIQT